MATLAELRKQTRCVHTLASEKIKTLGLSMERNFTWLSEILIEAKRSFASSELQLLPKTPSMKRKCQVRVQQRNIVDESSEEDAPPAKKKRNANRTRSSPKGKKAQVTDTSMLDASTADQSSTRSGRTTGAKTGRATRATRRRKAAETDEDSYADVDTPAMDVSTQSTRSTRASRKQNTDPENDRNSESASSTRPTRATRNTKAKTTAPPILKLQATRGHDNSDEDMEVDPVEEKQVRIKSDRDSIDRDSAVASTTDSPKSSFCSVETGSQRAAAEDRLDSFHKLSVKGKAQAYEELVKRASREDSGTECDTPETKTPMKENEPKTPNTVVAKQQMATPRRPVPDETEPHSPAVSEMDTNEETPVRAAQPSTAEKARKARRSSRVSGLRTSMQRKRSSIANLKLQVALMQREMMVSQESESKDSPARPQREPPVRNESESTDSDLVGQTPEKKTRPARSKLRLKKSKPAEDVTVSTSTEEEGFTSPKPHAKATRMTRSKMRPPPQVAGSPDSHSSEDNDKTPVVQNRGFTVQEEVPPCRSTRSKMRLPASSPKRGIQDNQKTGATPSKKQRCDESHPESPRTPKAESDEEEWEDEQTPVQPSRTRPKILKPLRAGMCLSASAKKKPSNLCSVSSFLSRHNTPTHNTTITSFIARNVSPKKLSAKEQLLMKRKELEEKERAQVEKQQKKQELLKKRAEEQKRKREEKMLQVVLRRQEQEKREKEMLQGLVRKQEEKKTMTARMKEDKKREERERLRLRQVKIAEAEERRKQEEEQRLQKLKAQEEEQQRQEEMMRRKREFEERERQQKLAEQRRLEEERRLEAERERQREQLRLKQLEEQRAREEQQRQREREERERREKEERERLEFEKLREKERQRHQELERQREQERQRILQERQQAAQEAALREEERKARAAIQKHNTTLHKANTSLNVSASAKLNMSAMKPTTKLNTTVTKDNSSESYIMTPQKKETRQPISEENYDITNLRSDDSSEDEDNPKKKIPNWARGHALKAALLSQHDNPPDIIALFGHMVELDLNNLFEKKKSRFNKRTSSAIWTSPIMKQ